MTRADRLILAVTFVGICAAVAAEASLRWPSEPAVAPIFNAPCPWTWTKTGKHFGDQIVWRGESCSGTDVEFKPLPEGQTP